MSTATAVTMLDVRAGSGAITLPLTTQIPYRVITIKDAYGAAGLSSIVINTQGTDVFENGASSITLTNAYDTTTLYAGLPGYWYTIGGSRLAATSFNTLSTGLITSPLRLGTLSTQTAIQFPGLRQGYTGTVIAEQGTGAGTQELLLYKASSISDQIRLQTTGSIVFETGAAARSFPSTTQLATPTLIIQGSTSNVGIGTAAPAATLDVAGTGRFQTLSSLTLNVSSINGAAPGGASFTGSTLALSTGLVYASNVMMSGPLNMNTNVISNAGTITESTYVSNMVLWFDGNDSTTLFQDGGGATPVTADNQSVYLWKDKSVYATNATPVTTSYSAVPKSTYGTQNSKNGIYFGGTSGFQFSSANMPGGAASNATYFFVAKQSSSSPPGQSFAAPTATILFTTGDQSQSAALRTTQNNSGMQVYIDGISPSGGSNWNSSVPYIQTLVVQSGQLIRRANGLQLDSTAFTGAVAANTGTGRISETFGSFYNYWNGQVYEVLVYNTYLLTTAMQQIEGYLAWKWGITLNAAHPYYAASPGITPSPSGTLTQFGSFGLDTANNIQITATNAIRLTSAVQIPTTLTTSSFTVSSINGAAPWQPSFLTSTVQGLASNISSMIDPTELTSTVTGLGTAGFISTVGLTYAVASTAQGLGTFGYTSTNQLLSTTIGVYGAIGSNITTTVQPQFASTVMGLGTVGYVSTAFTGSTTSLSAATIVVSSLATNSAKTSSLTMYGTLNMSNNLLTNIYSALFTPTYSGNPNAGAGGTYTTYTSGSITYAVHTFTVTGTTNFTPVTNIISAQVLIIGGGGSGGGPGYGGGGGAGGAVYLTNQTITSSGGPYLIVVGSGGAAVSSSGYNTGGNNGLLSSAFGSAGAGGGGGGSDGSVAGKNGGCGGGAGYGASAGTGSQGYNGGSGGLTNPGGGGGGGGMGGAGANYNSASPSIGGAGIVYSIVGYNVGYAAGGGAASSGSTTAVGGSANGTIIGGSGSLNASGTAGAANTGSGGGGCGTFSPYASGAGGSGIVIIAYPLNQFGITPYTVGTITGDATSNLSIQPVNNLNIVGTTQTSALLVASTFSTTFINATTVSTAALQVSTINGEAFTAATPFTGSTLSLSTASIFTSSLRASTISVGGGAWMSNDGLYLSNVQAGGAVGKLITNAGYVKLVTATAWNGGYGAFAITGGDLTPKIYMNAGQVATGAQMAIGGFNPSPGAGISLDVFGTGRFSSISTFQVVTSSMGVGTATPQALLDVAGTGRFQFISTLSLQTSSINGAAPWQQSYLTSTTEGLGTLGYISSTQLGSTVTNLITRIGAGGGGTTFVGSTIFLSASQILFSTQTGYNISSVQGYISSLQVDELQIGTGFGIIALGDTNMSSISTIGIVAGLGNFTTINVSSINGAIPGTGSGTSFTGNLGTVSSLTALRFYGLTGGYTNTAVAEVSTGLGTQELLLYKVSSISDQVRVQTTGNVIFETGVGARGWPTATRVLPPTLYIAGSNSNVGIGTSNPVTTLDVVGTGRFQTLSSLNITAGSINYSVAFV